MKYNLEINGETKSLSVAARRDGRLVVVSDGCEYRAAIRRIDACRLALVVDSVQVNAFIHGDHDAKEIMINGVFYRVCDADRKILAAVSHQPTDERPRDVTPPMPSVVVKVLVELDQIVARGDNLVVVAAMKMETTLTAPFDARVARINVGAGDKVMPGDILVDLEPVS